MKWGVFLELVEIRTKAASQFPLAFGLLYSLHRFGSFEPLNSLLMFLSLLLFDMATTGVNNYLDYVKSGDEEYRRRDNVIGAASLSPAGVRRVIGLLLIGASGFGILLAWRTGPVVLIAGTVSFGAGILYTAGPVPLSRLPLGEIFSGFFMGFVIPFLAVYIGNPDLVRLSLEGGILTLRLLPAELAGLFLVSLPFMLAISNIMLANNICDLEQDIRHDRYLLPYFIGLPRALAHFRRSYHLAYLSLIPSVLLGFLPPLSLIALVSVFPVNRNTGKFLARQEKGSTFVLAVRNLVLISVSSLLPLAVSAGRGFLR